VDPAATGGTDDWSPRYRGILDAIWLLPALPSFFVLACK
jgi:hypothetical protein